MFPGPGGLDAKRRVEVRRDAEVDAIDVAPLQKPAVIGTVLRDCERLGTGRGVIGV